jgi:hypothetical protein
VAKNDELPPMGLPLNEPSSSKYFVGVTAMVVVTGALLFGIGYGALQFASGPCDALHAEAVDGLRAEVDFLKESGGALGVNKVEVQELRASTQIAGDSLNFCCEEQRSGRLDEARFQQCRDHAAAMAALPPEIVAAHGEPAEAKKAIRKAANQLRGIASDLTDIASSSERDAASGVAAGPPSEE